MPLKFFGRGSAFADAHNSAFFIENNELVIIDCPASTFQKVKRMEWEKFDNIFILITHTHGDHAGGVGMMLQFVWFASLMKKRVTVVAPSDEVREDLTILLNRIEGCEPEWYDITTADCLQKSWFVKSVPTTHSSTLAGKCFGYRLKINGRNVVYTGDTATLCPFLPLLSEGSFLYAEAATFRSDVHLYLEDVLPTFEKLTADGVRVCLMHLDREDVVKKVIAGKNITLAPLYENDI
ncbi:MBL fold metallo-hydrolase [Ruminococcus albus]|uniref:Metallo-beta-lactamase domain protein n=1 Tax=Ruminococcus albus 8 TaxID=246199 RepID=E9S8V8_RUMAL|nr:MBL fold metallo-hydrolase [Ruminococcus albus]EGC04306.1 metallo-beta-lactamase domain protein [Ruminococcus albus 8]MCC3349680.1 MBL fold metallo-hydrolase [Ruminococcus albus 8]